MRPPALDKRLTVLHGSVRSSKTWSMIPKVMALCRYDVGGMGLFTGVSKQTIYQNVLSDLFNIIGNGNYSYNRQSGELKLFGRDCVVVGAKDEGSEKYIRGVTVGFAYGDELTLLPRSFVMMLLNRMSPTGARFYGTTNPDNPFHYVKTDLIDNQALIRRGDIESIHFTLDDNPNVEDSYKDYIRSFYSGVFKMRYVDGLWVVAEGAIYRDAWSEDLLYDDTTRPKGLLVRGTYLEHAVAVDYGTDHPQCYLDLYDDGATLWVEREYWWDSHMATQESEDTERWVPRDSHTQVTLRQKTDSEYGEDLEKFLAAQFDHKLNKWVPGVDCKYSDAVVLLPPECASFAAELMRRGLYYRDANHEVNDGIRTVSSLMKRRKIRIHKQNCPVLVQQMQTYAWDEKAGQRGEEKPIKHKDDAPDTLRYGAHTLVGENLWRMAA
jgi:PBSX family phage terminase large subunit